MVMQKRVKFPAAVRNEVWRRCCTNPDEPAFQNTCTVAFCQNTIDVFSFHVGHIQSLATGGSNSIDNLQAICAQCNLSMGKNTLSEWEQIYAASVQKIRVAAEKPKEEDNREYVIESDSEPESPTHFQCKNINPKTRKRCARIIKMADRTSSELCTYHRKRVCTNTLANALQDMQIDDKHVSSAPAPKKAESDAAKCIEKMEKMTVKEIVLPDNFKQGSKSLSIDFVAFICSGEYVASGLSYGMQAYYEQCLDRKICPYVSAEGEICHERLENTGELCHKHHSRTIVLAKRALGYDTFDRFFNIQVHMQKMRYVPNLFVQDQKMDCS